MGTVLGGLLLPTLQPFDYGRAMNQGILGAGGMVQNQTNLLALQDLQRQQEAQAVARQAYQQNPSLLLDAQPILGSLGPAGGPGGPGAAPAPGPITQQAFGPGGVTGPAQTVPAYPDASRYAGVSPQGGGPIPPDVAAQVMPTVTPPGGAPTSTLATLGPQPQANPLEALVRTNPDAAMVVLNQQTKMQEQQLTMRVKVADYMGSVLQGVNSQESYDEARREIARISPQWAQALPQVYSKEALEPFIQRALDVKTQRTLQLTELQRQTELAKARLEAGTAQAKLGEVEYKDTPQGLIAVPKYPTAGATPGVGGTPVTVGGQPVQGTAGQTQLQQQRTSEQGLQQHYDTIAKPYREMRDAWGRITASGTQPSPAGDLSLIYAYEKMLSPTEGVRNEEVRQAASSGGLPAEVQRWIEWTKGNQLLPDSVRKDFMERAKLLYGQYMKDYEQTAEQFRGVATRQGLNPANVVLDYRSTAAQPASTGQPRLLGSAELQSLAEQRSRALGRLVTVEEVKRDLDPKRFRTQ